MKDEDRGQGAERGIGNAERGMRNGECGAGAEQGGGTKKIRRTAEQILPMGGMPRDGSCWLGRT